MTYDVIVVGGGMAGLAAAHTLTHLGKTVGLFEASGRLGGRIFNLALEKGSTYQAGAVSIQGKSKMVNPLDAILKRHNIATQPLNSLTSDTFDTKGNQVSLKELHSTLAPEYNKALQRLQEAKNLKWITPPLLSEVFAYQDKSIPMPDIDSPAYWARKFITATITQHTGASLNEVSLLEFMQDEWGSEENRFILGGTDKLIDALYQEANATLKLTTHFNSKVVKILQSPEEDSQAFISEKSGGPNNILVFDQTGQSYRAEAIVIAVPFSILKQHKIQFIPELSQEKRNALGNFGVSHYNSVVLEFEQPFWDKDAHYLFPNGPNIEDWPQYLNGYYFSNEKSALLIAQFSGKKARFSTQTDQAIVKDALAPLQRVYGEKVTPLKFSYVTRFDTDPNIMGGSLYCSNKNRKEDFEALSKPEQGCYFAGDFTYAKRHGRLESAYESGLQAGLEVDTYLHYKKHLQQKLEDHLRPKF